MMLLNRIACARLARQPMTGGWTGARQAVRCQRPCSRPPSGARPSRRRPAGPHRARRHIRGRAHGLPPLCALEPPAL